MITKEFIEEIFNMHRRDKTVADHAMSTGAAVRSVLLIISARYNIPELKMDAEDLLKIITKYYMDERSRISIG